MSPSEKAKKKKEGYFGFCLLFVCLLLSEVSNGVR